MNKLAVIVLVVGLMASGCERGQALSLKYGTAFNSDRIKRGMTILPDEWEVYADLGTQIDWVNPEKLRHGSTGKPTHASKQMLLDRSGNLLSESDVYYSGKQIPHNVFPEKTINESMEIAYIYSRAHSGQSPWRALIIFGPDAGEFDLEHAKGILKKWGIQY